MARMVCIKRKGNWYYVWQRKQYKKARWKKKAQRSWDQLQKIIDDMYGTN